MSEITTLHLNKLNGINEEESGGVGVDITHPKTADDHDYYRLSNKTATKRNVVSRLIAVLNNASDFNCFLVEIIAAHCTVRRT